MVGAGGDARRLEEIGPVEEHPGVADPRDAQLLTGRIDPVARHSLEIRGVVERWMVGGVRGQVGQCPRRLEGSEVRKSDLHHVGSFAGRNGGGQFVVDILPGIDSTSTLLDPSPTR